MAYDSVWERLNEAVRRVMDAAGRSKEEAQADLCQAVADGVIRIRCRLKKQATGPMTSKSVLEGAAFDIPTTIKPDDLDWEQSRPLKPWFVKRGKYDLPGSWKLDWIKLSRTDIASVLCAPRDRGDAAHPTSSAKQSKAKSQPKVQAARRAIQALYPNGPPDQVTLSNKELVWRVGEKVKELGLPEVKPDTIFRASGRRRK